MSYDRGPALWRERNLRNLLILILLSSMVAWSVVPFIPLELLHKGASPTAVGVVVAGSGFGYLFGQYPAALLVGRIPVHRAAAIALLLEALGTIIILYTANPLLLVPLRLAVGGGRAVIGQCARAVVVRSIPNERRGEAFGIVGALTMAGTTVGTLGGGLLAEVQLNYVFVVAAASTLIAMPICLRLRVVPGHEPSEPPAHAPAATARRYFEAVVPLTRLQRGHRALLIGLLLETLGGALLIGVYNSVWSIFLRHHGAPVWVLGFAYALFTVPYLFLAPLAGRIGDRGHRKTMALAGTVTSSLLMLAYTRLSSLPAILSGELVEAVSGSLAEPALAAMVTEVGTEDVQEKVFGLVGTVQAASVGGGAMLGGWLLGWGVNVPLVAGGALALGFAGSAALVWRLVPQPEMKAPQPTAADVLPGT
ncbi:MAG TPA: MFS transporter [Trebonia sp.]|nr:MFS transporter [Trebonia sp.]